MFEEEEACTSFYHQNNNAIIVGENNNNDDEMMVKKRSRNYHCWNILSSNSILFLAFIFLAFGFSLAQDNNVVGEPLINCSPDAIYAKWKTNKTFTGHVNVRYAPNRFCYQVLVTNNQIELLVPHQECQVNRIRSLSPAGLILETSVLISFHPQFVTGDDRIYVLKCLHNRPKTKKHHHHNSSSETLLLTEGIPFDDANSNSTDSFIEDISAPEKHLKCGYNISDGDGTLIEDAAVGDIVKHRWWCSNTPPKSCLFVTNCFLKTYDSEHNLIGKDGCSSDIRVMPQLLYANETLIEADLRVFGVAQRPIVHFQCQLNLIPAMEDGICPLPVCATSHAIRKRRDVVSYLSSDSAISFDAVSQEIEVLQPGAPPKKQQKCHSSDATKIEKLIPEHSVCVSKVAFTLVSVATITVAIITLGIVVYFTIQRVHYSDVPSTD